MATLFFGDSISNYYQICLQSLDTFNYYKGGWTNSKDLLFINKGHIKTEFTQLPNIQSFYCSHFLVILDPRAV